MHLLLFTAAGLSSLIHVVFFAEESLFWMNPKVHQDTFGMNEVEAGVTKLFAFNQGFYNLFLAIGVTVGAVLFGRGLETVGSTLLIFGCLSMCGAALVLLGSKPKLWLGAVIQGVPPLVTLVSLWMSQAE